ncbi:hypothetical protein B0H12DRAFT_1070777 [Mycena haematopus]|nr:hypothetical protein B0H12DRAFT_1070777 [Mycena haematopus]
MDIRAGGKNRGEKDRALWPRLTHLSAVHPSYYCIHILLNKIRLRQNLGTFTGDKPPLESRHQEFDEYQKYSIERNKRTERNTTLLSPRNPFVNLGHGCLHLREHAALYFRLPSEKHGMNTFAELDYLVSLIIPSPITYTEILTSAALKSRIACKVLRMIKVTHTHGGGFIMRSFGSVN